jgi:hypothetical protein
LKQVYFRDGPSEYLRCAADSGANLGLTEKRLAVTAAMETGDEREAIRWLVSCFEETRDEQYLRDATLIGATAVSE